MHFDLALNNACIMGDAFGWEPFIGSVGIKDGRYRYIGNRCIYPEDSEELLNLDQAVVMPGLVNGHIHGDMTLARGLGDALTLAGQNEAFSSHNWFKHFLSNEDRVISRQLTYAEALLSGCTFILENMYWSLGDAAIDAVLATGIRAALAEDYRVDFRDSTRLHSAEELKHFADQCRASGVVPVLGSVAEEDFDVNRLKLIRELAAQADMRITAHIAETKWRQDIVRERFGQTSIEFLAGQNFLGPDLIASHVVYTTEEERILLYESRTKVINTPLCEYKIADGLAAVPEMLEAGVSVGLGTDGALWNNNIDLFREMKGLLLANSLRHGPARLKPKQVLRMATVGGHAAFGTEGAHDIQVGNPADFIILDYSKAKFLPLRFGINENISSSLVFNATAEDVRDVFVGGVQLVRDGSLCQMDQQGLFRDAQERGDTLAAALVAELN